jgi:hypothetical protein
VFNHYRAYRQLGLGRLQSLRWAIHLAEIYEERAARPNMVIMQSIWQACYLVVE